MPKVNMDDFEYSLALKYLNSSLDLDSVAVVLPLCVCIFTVSEPTLKWKLKKLISARPNPLQRKISAPPAVKHRTEPMGTNVQVYLP